MAPQALHIKTPLIPSPGLSRRSGCRVFLKLDALQPSGSFKTRGVGAQVLYHVRERGPNAHLICSSGGNAGLACAYAAKKLDVKCSVFVPITTSQDMVARLRAWNAEVIQGGVAWHEADAAARKAVAADPQAAYVHPFEHPALVRGNSTVVLESADQLRELGLDEHPDGIICSVGGGGLLAGVLHGVQTLNWMNSSILAVETYGAASFHASLRASYKSKPPRPKLQPIDGIQTIATSMGATRVSESVLDAALHQDSKALQGAVCSIRMEDAPTVAAMTTFLDEHFLLVEPSCSACIVPLMMPGLLQTAISSATRDRIHDPDETKRPIILVIVCGGNAAPLRRLLQWQTDFGLAEPVECGGTISKDAYSWSVYCGARGIDVTGESALS